MLNGRNRILSLLAIFLGFLSTRAHAVQWFPYGPDGGDARQFAADPSNPKHIYLGTTNGWIYQSHDGGAHWARLAKMGERDDLILDNILVDPANPKHLIVGALKAADLHSPDAGIFVSNDAGATWTTPPDMRGQTILALADAPSNHMIMVAGTMEGVFRSSDNGNHWQLISPKADKELHEVESVAIDPADPNIIYAGTWHLPWKTTDGGATWKIIKQGIAVDSDVFSIIVDPKQPNIVYASACSGIYRSEDGGEKFIPAAGIPTTAHRTRVLMQDPNHLATVFAGTTAGLYRTDDNGKVWTETTGSDVIVNDVYVDPSDSRRVLLATDRQGVLASDDGGITFTPSNAGFSTRQIKAYVADAQHPATLYVGVVNDKQWGGVFVSHSGGLNWSQESDGLDGRDVLSLGQAPDGAILAGTDHGIYRLKDAVWQRASEDGRPAARSARKLAVSATRPHAPAHKGVSAGTLDGSVYAFATAGETLYAATSNGLLRSPSSGVGWTPVPSVPVDEYRFLASAKSSVLAGSLSAAELSTDAGATWRPVALPPQVNQISALCVDGQGNLWIGGREGVFYSSDSGATWKNLREVYVRNANNIFFDAAHNRVFVTATAPETIAFAIQLPSMQVSSWDTGWDLRFVRPVGDHLLAGTLYDGIVIQPRMIDPAEIARH